MAEEEANVKTYNDEESKEEPGENEKKKKLISVDNANFSKKNQLLNSPRSLEACLHLGVDPTELYQLNMNEFKKKYPEVKGLDKDLLKFRYESEENFRKETINQVKEERKVIIESENKKKEEESKKKENEDQNNKDEQNDKDETEKRWEKIIENEKKNIEKIKKRQRQNIENIIEEQINKELIQKVTEVKDKLKKEREEEAQNSLRQKESKNKLTEKRKKNKKIKNLKNN